MLLVYVEQIDNLKEYKRFNCDEKENKIYIIYMVLKVVVHLELCHNNIPVIDDMIE